jgi:hypothetical protein
MERMALEPGLLIVLAAWPEWMALGLRVPLARQARRLVLLVLRLA